MIISIVVPTFQRPDFLKKALGGLLNQNRKPDQVIIGLRDGDEETARFIANFQGNSFTIETVSVSVPGVIASMNAAIHRTKGDIVCLLDDDAEPLPEWLEKIEAHFSQQPKLGALGGRDLLQDHPEMRRQEPVTESVGLFTKYGRIIGNHHCGAGPFREVDLFKGCNAAVKGDLLREIGLETHLKGKGAQVNWELALCLDIQRRGYFVAYDPAVQVIHYIAPRLDDDLIHRGHFSKDGLYDLIYNEHFVIHSRLRGSRRFFHFLWSWMVGTLTAPGFVQYARGKLRREKHMEEKVAVTSSAIMNGMRDGSKFFSRQTANRLKATKPSVDTTRAS